MRANNTAKRSTPTLRIKLCPTGSDESQRRAPSLPARLARDGGRHFHVPQKFGVHLRQGYVDIHTGAQLKARHFGQAWNQTDIPMIIPGITVLARSRSDDVVVIRIA